MPIVLAFVDCERKIGGLGPLFTPTGDLERELARIELFCAPIKGKRPTQFVAKQATRQGHFQPAGKVGLRAARMPP